MKNQLGLKAMTLITLCLVAWSISFAQASKAGQTLDAGEYTVWSATGGHMRVGDIFEIQLTEGTETPYTLLPKNDPNNSSSSGLHKRWGGKEIRLEAAGEADFCGYLDLDTPAHMGNQYGHDRVHGILVKKQPNDRNGKPQVKIIWSALPLKDKTSKNCNNLEKRFHGGMAHASQ